MTSKALVATGRSLARLPNLDPKACPNYTRDQRHWRSLNAMVVSKTFAEPHCCISRLSNVFAGKRQMGDGKGQRFPALICGMEAIWTPRLVLWVQSVIRRK